MITKIDRESADRLLDTTDRTRAWASNMTISLTAHRGDEEPWRLLRLAQVLVLLSSDQHHPVLPDISALGDAKGTLYVTWNRRPDSFAKATVEHAWRAVDEEMVEHIEPEPDGRGMTETILGYSRGEK